MNAAKLGIKPGAVATVTGLPLDAAEDLIGELPNGANLVERSDHPDLALLFAESVADVSERAQAVFDTVGDSGRFWIAYRKGAKPLHRDTLQAALAPLGLDGVTLVSLSSEWSAMRVRPAK